MPEPGQHQHADHAPHGVERHCDVAVVGGSAAGLAAALRLVRRGRSVIVIDGGEPRDRPTDATRKEVRSYGGEVLAGRVERVARRDDGRFSVELVGGHAVVARRVVETNATGLVDELPGDEDLSATAGPSANESDWDQRYSGDRMWSGNPNGSLVGEVGAMAPGRALDVGAGEGGDALWLAEQGWRVTASDISQQALARIKAEAERRHRAGADLDLEYLHVDANAPDAFAAGAFDLVSAQYASIPKTPDARAIRNLLDAVAPGGTLLVVGHDPGPLRAPVDLATASQAFDADAYVQASDVAAALADQPGWEVQVNELRPRPPGATSASHHVDDVVLRARRRAE